VLLALATRIAYWALVTPDWLPNSDADQYLRLGRAIANGDGYSLVFPQLEMHATAFRPPLYPLLLAVPSAVFGDEALWPVRLLSVILSLGVVALTVVYVRRIAGDLAAVVAGCAVAVMPSIIANDTVSLTEPLGLLLVLAILILLDQHRPVLVGLAAGALMLTRPNAYLVVLIAAVFVWKWVGWRKAALCAACAIAVLVPWAVRNAIQVDTWRLTTSEGFNLAAIYAPPAQERRTFVDPVFDAWYDDTDHRIQQFDEAQWNAGLSDLAIQTIKENPGYVLDVVGNNLLALAELKPANNEFAERIDGRNLDFRRATLAVFYVFLLAGLFGLGTRITEERMWPAYLIVGQFVLLSLLLVSPPRLRAPLDLVLCIGVGFAVDFFYRLKRDRSDNSESDNSESDQVQPKPLVKP
jgi:4-amino-4-deoxy-L-arabinose transferase-like glycosyltransferase